MSGALQLDEVANTVLDANGNGSVTLSPHTSRQVWQVTNIAVSGSSVTKIPISNAYLGTLQLGGTYSGTNDSDNVTATVWPGQSIRVTWTGGDPGASAAAYVYGTYSTTGST
jgi:hypothetical protein